MFHEISQKVVRSLEIVSMLFTGIELKTEIVISNFEDLSQTAGQPNCQMVI